MRIHVRKIIPALASTTKGNTEVIRARVARRTVLGLMFHDLILKDSSRAWSVDKGKASVSLAVLLLALTIETDAPSPTLKKVSSNKREGSGWACEPPFCIYGDRVWDPRVGDGLKSVGYECSVMMLHVSEGREGARHY